MSKKYWGKYRGVVVNNVDPMSIGRVLVNVPDVLGIGVSSWALPCVPYGGPNAGTFAVPTPGTKVWLEFEQGDPDYPIYVGAFWGSALETPTLAKTTPAPLPAVTVQTPANNGMVIADAGGPSGLGGITLATPTGEFLMINSTGIFLNNGKGASITMTGPLVDINLGALLVK